MSATGTCLLRGARAGALLLALSAAAAHAQTATTGAVRGTVRSAAGEPLGDALVTLVAARSGARYQATTSREGEYRLERLPAGQYAAIAEQIGYAPAYRSGVPVRPGLELDVPLVLRAGGPTELALDSADFGAGTASLGRAAASRWLAGAMLQSLPYAEPDLAEAAGLVSWLDRDLGAEGLPGRFTALALDGHQFQPAAHPLVSAGRAGLLAPAAGGAAELSRVAADAEWRPPAGAVLDALARRGSDAFAGGLAGQGSGGPLAQAGFFDAGSLGPRLLRGSALLEGSAFGDSARFAIGGTYRNDRVARSPAWANTAENAAAAAAGAWIGNLEANLQPQLLERASFAGFAQLDWRLAASQRLGVTLAASKPADEPADAPASGASWPVEGQDLLAGLSLFTELGTAANQLRFSWASSSRESFGTAPTAIGIMVPGGLRLNGSEAARFEERAIRLFDAVQLRAGAHAFRLGGDLAVSTHNQAWRPGAVAEVLFGGVPQLQQSTGVFRQTIGGTPSVDWSGQTIGLFVQDSWHGESGPSITAVLRAERNGSSDAPARDAEWFRLTGLGNDLAADESWRLSPRLDVSWAAGEHREFVVNAAAGLFHDRVDPLLVGEWLVDDGSADVYRFLGNVGVWTVSRPAGATSRTSLTLPVEALRGPETARATAGFAVALGGGTTLAFDASFRHTRFLPRRSDLNLLPAALAHDQYGRPVFGTLVKQGALLAATPGSNRRFPDYDVVSALDLDGWSTWYGGTARLERPFARDFLLGASYTYSRTRDNWVGALYGRGVGTPVAELDQSGDWSEGTSDFDVPHRGALYAAWTPAFGLEVSGLFRYESGRPFTPAFPYGVDVNGDGVTGNDPAYIDPAVTGASELVARWDSLRRASG
ncbi:MAG: carboxypeptidase regulatory-like domain-containing protein, partial [Gemmatimonadetes bacterium]|nr:carboxypeptidase regulatory-like domain-containing protein [Gemmatimonadota bacterium]